MIYYPADWMPGQLLHVAKFTDGSIKVTKLEDQDKQSAEGMDFDSSFSAQDFISWWYASPLARVDGKYGSAQKALSPGRGADENKNVSVGQPIDAAHKREISNGKITGDGRPGAPQKDHARPVLRRSHPQGRR